MQVLLQPRLMEFLLGNKEISLMCYSLVMVFSSFVLPVKTCTACGRGAGGTKGKDQGLT